MPKFTQVDFNCKKYVRFSEHEIFMSFHNDSAAWRFRNWWDEEGAELFYKWLEGTDGD